MMKILKIFGLIILILFAIIAIGLIAAKVNHEIQLSKENKKHVPPGNMVEVNGKQFHVYTEGKGDITLVFMAGHGTTYPTLDFKPLWLRMRDEYRITVVEKTGYGWSEITNRPRDIDTMLEETRKALALSGERGPYVLFPHSRSGLEALYWGQKYPDEVKAIIGLDPLTPETVAILPEPQNPQLYLMYFISRIGLSRLMPEAEVEDTFPLLKSDLLTMEEKQAYLANFYRTSLSRDMLNEIRYLDDNAKQVAENGTPADTPMYFFISDGQEEVAKGWKASLTTYLSKITISESMQLNTGHYVHYEKAEIIAEEARAFIKEIE
jgi:pimeloyl-ACP methyl ester carboxylesterase